MVEKKIYANGQKVYDLSENKLTYYYKSGALKAEGSFIKNKKEGLWHFYRAPGHLWKVGEYKNGLKQGWWQHYSSDGQVEYDAYFEDDKQVKKH